MDWRVNVASHKYIQRQSHGVADSAMSLQITDHTPTTKQVSAISRRAVSERYPSGRIHRIIICISNCLEGVRYDHNEGTTIAPVIAHHSTYQIPATTIGVKKYRYGSP